MSRELPCAELSQCEAAVQGLRKSYLKREWAPRCATCGVRHEDIEFGTCKFWAAYLPADVESESNGECSGEGGDESSGEDSKANRDEAN